MNAATTQLPHPQPLLPTWWWYGCVGSPRSRFHVSQVEALNSDRNTRSYTHLRARACARV